jgi:photosystem II stability/assembly factor-like uncharacterized protein
MPRPIARITFTLLLLVVFVAHPAGEPQNPPAGFATAAPVLTSDLVGGLALRTVGPAATGGRIVDLAVLEARPSTFFAASATGGLWKTTNNGVTFEPLFDGERVHSIGAVAVFQPNPEIVWIGSGEASNRQSSSWGDGVYKSTDGGRTWDHMGLRDSKHIARVALHPTSPDIVFVAALGHLWGPNRERGLYKSIDGGKTWRSVLFVDNDTGVVDVAIDPADPKVMYAAAYQRRRRVWGFHGGGPGSGLYKSVDGGDTWTKLATGLPSGDKGRIGIAIFRKDPRILYVCIEQGERYDASGAYAERKAGIYRSENRGESWTHAGDWNPRPMSGSQIRVDPNDDQRVYMVDTFSYSDDGGKTFVTPRQSLRGDDRAVWIDPRDSRHLIKADAGGLGLSYDRGETWLSVSTLPISQLYRVSVDMRKPFWIYGGLQDNGSWAGPSATTESQGVLNEHWVRTGGGDGFANVIDPTDNRTLYTSTAFLGLSRFDMVTRERVDIRPGNPRGAMVERRNWDTWARVDAPPQELVNTMPPANWDAPVVLSPHDSRILYAGTNELWRSSDRGQTWAPLGLRTTEVDRATLRVMTQLPTETTPSLDDGVPYYPTVSAIAESPARRGVLWVGTDDGNLQISRDAGKTWLTIGNRLPSLPKSSYVSSIEASRHAENTVYVAFDNHRNDDYGNYLYRTTDGGATWTAIDGDLPSDRVIRVVREDPKNPQVLYLGAELGCYVSVDQGQHWIALGQNLPRVAVNDLIVHPRDNDLVLATHGRGLWILDNLASLQGLTPAVLASSAHLFPIEAAEMIRYDDTRAPAGDMVFRGQNPPAGAIIDYYLKSPAPTPTQSPAITVHDAAGRQVASIAATAKKGINRVVWNLRYPATGIPGPFVLPGTYTVRLAIGGKTLEQTVEVRDDARIDVTAEIRRQWTDTVLQLADLYRSSSTLATAAKALADKSAGAPATDLVVADRRELARLTRELQSRVRRLYTAVNASVSYPTADQRAQVEYLSSLSTVIDARLRLAQTR